MTLHTQRFNHLIMLALLALLPIMSHAQETDATFRNYQLGCTHVNEACKKYNDTLAREFKKKNLAWPPKDIYLRAFKSQNEMELWARNTESAEYKLVKTYRICAISGQLGPKRTKGDRQIPEGYYFIEEFNPKSEYYLSMRLSYPNYSDSILGIADLGGDIYIHGGCVTIGCMPMTDDGIKELYTLCLTAKLNGQEFIPVHIFPTRLNKSGMAYLKSKFPHDPEKQQFWAELKSGFEYFEKTHKILPVMYSPEGRYVY
jgi:murein L,D-transpeptidase YafK